MNIYPKKDKQKNHRVVVSRHGGPEVLEMIEEPMPVPQVGEVLVRVHAAGVSAYDLMFRKSGSLPGTPKVPFTLGTDIVGVVERLGEDVTNVEPGQTVAGATFASDGLGGYTETICLPAKDVVPVPADVDPAQAVCLVANYLTAHMAMYDTAKVRPGERVLVHGAAGGVGTALLELGKQAGLEMYGTASEPKHKLVSALGATPIDYRNEDFVERVHVQTGGGVDVVFDPIGGARQLWRSNQALRKGGRLVWFGVAATKKDGLRVIPITMLTVGLLKLWPDGKQLLLTRELGADNAWYRSTLADLLDMLSAGEINPVVSAKIPLAESSRAHELLERGQYAGRVVLVTDYYTESLNTEHYDGIGRISHPAGI